MALMIRLRQHGRCNAQTYRLVVTDKRNPRDGKYIEKLGWYNPLGEKERHLFIDGEKVQFWLQKGAIMSEKAKALIKRVAPEVIQNYILKKEEKKLRRIAKRKKKHAS